MLDLTVNTDIGRMNAITEDEATLCSYLEASLRARFNASPCKRSAWYYYGLDDGFVVDTTWHPIGVAYFGVISYPGFAGLYGEKRRRRDWLRDRQLAPELAPATATLEHNVAESAM